MIQNILYFNLDRITQHFIMETTRLNKFGSNIGTLDLNESMWKLYIV